MQVMMQNTADGGEVCIINGRIQEGSRLYTAVYLSLLGGNLEDKGLADTTLQWWGNLGEPDENAIFRGQFQAITLTGPITPSYLKRVQAAAAADLKWLESQGVSNISVTVRALTLNRITVIVELDYPAGDLLSAFEFEV